MTHFTELPDLLSERLGGEALAANDEFFAGKENLVKAARPVFIEDRFTDRGKWMDGWETRRRREPGHDWCLLRLGLPGVIRGVEIDTAYFKGNYPEAASLEAAYAARELTPEQLLGGSIAWVEVLPKTGLHGDTRNFFPVSDPRGFSHVRLHLHPDGGVARLRVHGEVVADPRDRGTEGGPFDLAALANGGAIVRASDAFFGPPHQLIMPGDSNGMHDGWETRRQRRGHDWCIIRLAGRGEIERALIDTSHFKGNYPDRCALDVCDLEGASLDALMNPYLRWTEILAPVKLGPDRQHEFAAELRGAPAGTHVRLRIFPDGGVARLRLFGRLSVRSAH